MESFLLNDGRYFKNDDRFFLLYRHQTISEKVIFPANLLPDIRLASARSHGYQ